MNELKIILWVMFIAPLLILCAIHAYDVYKLVKEGE